MARATGLFLAICASVGVTALGAPCPTGVTLATLAALPSCQVSASNNSSINWSLSGFILTQASTIGFGSGANVTPVADDIIVSISGVTNGFSVSFSDNPRGTNAFNFFAPAATSGNSQQVNWKTQFLIRPTDGSDPSNANINTAILSLQNPTGSDAFSVDKQFQDPITLGFLNPTDAQVFYSNGSFILGTSNPSSPTSVFNPARTAGILITDVVQFNSGQNGTGSIDSYTNTFTGAAVIVSTPEPTSLFLLGAGLAGLYLRRRLA